MISRSIDHLRRGLFILWQNLQLEDIDLNGSSFFALGFIAAGGELTLDAELSALADDVFHQRYFLIPESQGEPVDFFYQLSIFFVRFVDSDTDFCDFVVISGSLPANPVRITLFF
jgi:hypothetical protein